MPCGRYTDVVALGRKQLKTPQFIPMRQDARAVLGHTMDDIGHLKVLLLTMLY